MPKYFGFSIKPGPCSVHLRETISSSLNLLGFFRLKLLILDFSISPLQTRGDLKVLDIFLGTINIKGFKGKSTSFNGNYMKRTSENSFLNYQFRNHFCDVCRFRGMQLNKFYEGVYDQKDMFVIFIHDL